MKNAIVLLADGFEEMEAVLPIDLMRRAGIFVRVVSMNETTKVVGSRDIVIEADILYSVIHDECNKNIFPDAVFCPGGLNGSINLSNHAFVKEFLPTMAKQKKIIAAMCACPPIALAPLGLLDGKAFTCYPGMEKLKQYAPNANLSGHSAERVVIDENLITSQGPGSAAELAFALIEKLVDNATSNKVKTEALF